jgi:hypothetical protein
MLPQSSGLGHAFFRNDGIRLSAYKFTRHHYPKRLQSIRCLENFKNFLFILSLIQETKINFISVIIKRRIPNTILSTVFSNMLNILVKAKSRIQKQNNRYSGKFECFSPQFLQTGHRKMVAKWMRMVKSTAQIQTALNNIILIILVCCCPSHATNRFN